MSRLVALEWDAKEARVVVGRKRGAALGVEQAFEIPLPQREEGQTADPDISSALSKALVEHGIGKGEALVAVGRASIELRFLSTPPVPVEELPEVVRFQALRQFTTLGEEWPLDFVPLGPNADGGMNVLAAAIAPDLVEQIRKACAGAGIHVSRLVLRPFAAAALIQEQLGDGKCRMIVDLLQDEADLTVLIGPQVIFPRTVRLPAVNEPEALARAILAEGRRTMIAAQNQLGGRRVEEVVIFGDGQHHTTLKQLLEKDLSLTVRLVDPFDSIEWVGDARSRRPEYPGTFAPLLGMLLDESAARPPVVDFLHARKRPEPPNQKRRYAIDGAAAAAVVLLAVGALQWQLWSLDGKISKLKSEKTKLDKLAKASVGPVKDAAKLELYAAADINWLDEMARLAEKLPPPTQARIEEFRANAQAKGGGNIIIRGGLDKTERLAELEVALRDKDHSVSGSGGAPVSKVPNMPWRFDETITISPPTKANSTKAGPTKAAATKAGTAKAGATPTKTAATMPPATKTPEMKTPTTQTNAARQGGQQ
jgi:Tfp pilus assembly PilM family ATPase